MATSGDQRRSDNRVAEKFVPASDWSWDTNASYLLVDLLGFKKEELRLEVASTGHITISGERIVNENKSTYFEETFRLPEDSDTDKIRGKFDGDFLHVTVPRRSATVVENKQEDESKNEEGNSMGENNTRVQEEPKDNGENQSKLDGGHGDHEQHYDDNEEKGEIRKKTTRIASLPLEMAMELLKKNKGLVLSVVIAFSIGMLVCRTFESSARE